MYRIPSDGGEPMQLTNLLTGVSGITALSPAMSAAGGRVIFSAYEEDGYNVTHSTLKRRRPAPRRAYQRGSTLPPRTKAEGTVAATLQNPTASLPPVAELPEEEPYKPKFGLDFAGQPSIGVGADPFGTYATGGVSFLFSDVLGNHVLATSAQVTSRFDEFGGGVMYLNRVNRWNWGVALSQIPYVSRGYARRDRYMHVEQEFRVLQTDRSLNGVFTYPFTKAQRLEVTGGGRQIGFKQDVTIRTYSLQTGQQLDESREVIQEFENLNLGEASAALVYDTSIFGAASPIRGTRYRLEASQSIGSLNYTALLADGRQYVMPVRPFTLAARGMFFGRFGSDGEDFRLPALFLGYPGLVRGYDRDRSSRANAASAQMARARRSIG